MQWSHEIVTTIFNNLTSFYLLFQMHNQPNTFLAYDYVTCALQATCMAAIGISNPTNHQNWTVTSVVHWQVWGLLATVFDRTVASIPSVVIAIVPFSHNAFVTTIPQQWNIVENVFSSRCRAYTTESQVLVWQCFLNSFVVHSQPVCSCDQSKWHSHLIE